MSGRLDCACCGTRDTTEAHIGRCRRNDAARAEAEAHAAAQAIPSVTTADLWAHLGHVASPEDATRIVRQVVDLGWRPVVGSDDRRLWKRATVPVAPPSPLGRALEYADDIAELMTDDGGVA